MVLHYTTFIKVDAIVINGSSRVLLSLQSLRHEDDFSLSKIILLISAVTAVNWLFVLRCWLKGYYVFVLMGREVT